MVRLPAYLIKTTYRYIPALRPLAAFRECLSNRNFESSLTNGYVQQTLSKGCQCCQRLVWQCLAMQLHFAVKYAVPATMFFFFLHAVTKMLGIGQHTRILNLHSSSSLVSCLTDQLKWRDDANPSVWQAFLDNKKKVFCFIAVIFSDNSTEHILHSCLILTRLLNYHAVTLNRSWQDEERSRAIGFACNVHGHQSQPEYKKRHAFKEGRHCLHQRELPYRDS